MSDNDQLHQEMGKLYRRIDPWNYAQANRHMVTAGLVQSVWDGGTLMELPCAEGALLNALIQWIRPTPVRVVTCDMHPVPVMRTTELMEREGGRLPRQPEFVIQMIDLRKSFPSEKAHLIVISDVLPYVPDHTENILLNAWDRLMPGGHMVVTSWLDYPEQERDLGVGIHPLGDPVQTLRWEGDAVNLEGETYDTWADYAVYKKPS